ncbi:synaptotagmin-4-like isoform X2 [Dendronephthya gigantea]|uniref:synaptotagmin-4-like isoform X2 n=1 Tax=Dendronephthya gigantea TaxID=151771 RepID=UPI00106CA291|nr:synaptotagmin-4-like isoform X2 [Dendronephthya gigantea]
MAFSYRGVNMDVYVAKIIAITLSVLVALVVLFMFVYRYIIRKRSEQQSKKVNKPKGKEKISRYRPAPLRLDEVRYHRVPSQFTPLVITPTTPNQFTIPPSRQYLEDGRSGSLVLPPTPDHTKGNLSPSTRPGGLLGPPKLLRALSEGCHPSAFKSDHVPPHGKIECFLKHEEESNRLFVQILGKKGHSLSWMTGISNPYIRVTLISSRECETALRSCSKNLNLPSNPSCNLDCIEDVNLRDCLLKFVVLDFDRFSRSEFVAEVLVPLGDLGDLREGVTICKELMLQQKVMLAPRGSLLISLCNQSMAQQLQVIILKADGIPSKSSVSLAGSGKICVLKQH